MLPQRLDIWEAVLEELLGHQQRISLRDILVRIRFLAVAFAFSSTRHSQQGEMDE